MKGYAAEKATDGKLVKIKVEFDQNIEKVQILGDFFLHPEDAIFQMETKLRGVPAIESQEVLQNLLQDSLKEQDAKLIGMSAELIAQTIRKAIDAAHETTGSDE